MDITKEQIIESKELREQLASRVEVLETVKKLLLIPKTEFATVKQVAEFYEVGETVIEKIYMRNGEELKSDGMCLKSYKDFLNGQHVGLEKMSGKVIFKFDDETELSIPNRGLKVFPRRAILRIGMLLRDSTIAAEVRTQLLNIEEKTPNKIKTQDITEEQALTYAVGMAFASGDPTAIMIATTNMMEFKNRHITELETHNRVLAGEILDWGDRKRLNSGIRNLANNAGIPFGSLWNELYKELSYKHGFSVKQRGDKPYIQWIEESEWDAVVQTFTAMCEKYGTTIVKMIPHGNGLNS